VCDRAAAGEPEPHAAGDALELGRRERRVHGNDADAASCPRSRRLGRLAEDLADGHTVHDETGGWVEVGEDEDADGAPDGGRDPARRTDAGLPTLRHHPRPGPDGAFRHRATGRGGDGAADVRGLHLDDATLRQPAVVALPDDGNDEVLRADARFRRDGDLNRSVVDAADGVGRREVDGGLDAPPFADLQRACELAGTVQDGRPCRNRLCMQRLDRCR
jgi:hypothetical protein